MTYVLKETGAMPAAKFKYKGVFDFDGMMNYMFKWLQDRGFEVNEKKHKHKMSCPKGFEIEWDIDAWRKIDDFYKYWIQVSIHTWDSYQVDAIKDGKKVKLWYMRIEFATGFKVECDYQNKWNTQFMQKLLKFYCEYVIKKQTIVKHGDALYYKMLELHTHLKKFAGMTATHYR